MEEDALGILGFDDENEIKSDSGCVKKTCEATMEGNYLTSEEASV